MLPLLAILSLTTPLMLGGLVLLSLPLLAHLLNRHARRTVVFPTIRLLQASAATQSKLFKLRRLILLSLRLLLVALVVFAFARPVWFSSQSQAAAQDGSAGVVLLVDTSLSAGQSTTGVPLLQSLQAAAGRVPSEQVSPR